MRSTLSRACPLALEQRLGASGTTARIFLRPAPCARQSISKTWRRWGPGSRPAGRRQALEGGTRKPDVSRMVGTPPNDRRGRLTTGRRCAAQRAAPRHWRAPAGTRSPGAGRALAVAVAAVGHELEEPVLHMLLGVGGHKGALAWRRTTRFQPPARRWPCAPSPGSRGSGRPGPFRWDGLARLPFTGLQALQISP